MLLSPRTSIPGYHSWPQACYGYPICISIPIREPQLRDVIKLPAAVITQAEPGRRTLWRPRTSAGFPKPLSHLLERTFPISEHTPSFTSTWTVLEPFAFALYLPQQSPKQDRNPFLITLAFVQNHLLRSYSVKHCARCEGHRDERSGRPKCWWVLTMVIRPS